MLVINQPALAKAAAEESHILLAESKWQELRHACLCWARSFSYRRGIYGALLSSVLAGRRDVEVAESAEPAARPEGMTTAQIRLVDRNLIGNRIRTFKSSLPAIARNSVRIREAIVGTSLAVPEEPSYGTWNHFMLPVRYENGAQRDKGRQLLLRKRVDTSPLYSNCVRNARRYGYRGGCPQAELASQTVCTVPNHEWLSDHELEHIGAALRVSAEGT